MHDGVTYGGGWLVMLLMMMLFWGGLAALAVWAVTQLRGDRHPQARPPDPEDVLAQRFARGEIDGDELQKGRELLRAR